MNMIHEIFSEIPRLGPGCAEATRKAFGMLKDLPERPSILDIGCGTGMQTLELARLSRGNIIALDNHVPYLQELRKRAEEKGFSQGIETVHMSMFELDFDKEGFDLIWSEGAVFIIGFEKGLREWKEFLKPGGYLAVTELSWLKENPPEELGKFFDAQYPVMKSIEGNRRLIGACGYTETGCFVLPETAWWDDFYHPLEKRTRMLQEKYTGNKDALVALECVLTEIRMYRDYPEWYGNVFYLMRKKG
jgi:ubiquinone/menaquinone biosynthesis C-methylase UbiE